MNDPHGVVHADGEYHMFFQYVPHSTAWEVGIHWGRAVSPDLVQWRHAGVALAPSPDETGCWSGSVVQDDRGPVMFYTRPATHDWGHGLICSARPAEGMDSWQRTRPEALIDGPPGGFIQFRDPNVRRHDDRWSMVVGAGLPDVGGCALQYSSTDLETWTYEGILALRPAEETAPLTTGTVWECPQFIEVDGHWVLLVSALDYAEFSEVVYAIGDYDGARFTPRRWGHFGHTRTLYATTTFHDAQGRPCAISWLREANDEVPAGSPWAGAQSLTHVLRIVDERLVVGLHPSLVDVLPDSAAARPDVDPAAPPLGTGRPMAVTLPWRVGVELDGSGGWAVAEPVSVEVVGDGGAWRLELDPARRRVRVTSGAATLLDSAIEAVGAHGRLDVVVDADIAEILWSAGEGVHVVHVPVLPEARVTISRDTPRASSA